MEMEIGAKYLGNGRCRFSVWAPLRQRVALRLTAPAERLIPMERLRYGYWQIEAADVSPGTPYFYRLDGELDRPDPASRFQPDGVHGASRVVDHGEFGWTDQKWRGIGLDDMVIYELHVGTFTKEGTFDSAIERLGYLRELGVTAVELMPLAQFPGSRNWGYDGAYSFAVQNSYGGPGGLKRLVDACHRVGLAVVLDVVYNHFGPEGAYVADFGPYFAPKYVTPWGAALNYDDAWSDGPRNFVIQNALGWFSDYHIDALRLDAIQGIFDAGAKHILRELAEQTRRFAEADGRQRYLIAESDLNDARVVAPMERHGYGLDAQWSDDFHHALHSLLTGERRSYYGDFGEIDHLVKAYREGFVYSWTYSENRKRYHGSSSAEIPGERLVVCTQNHDQIGNRLLGERLSVLLPFAAQKLAAGAMLTSPFVPLLFMGEEYGEQAPFLYFVSHTDERLVEAVREGRAMEFSSFNWEGETYDPQSEETFNRCKLDWSRTSSGNHAHMLAFYRNLLALRKRVPALRSHDRSSTVVGSPAGSKVLVLHRREAESGVVIVMNFSREPGEVNGAVVGDCGPKLVDADSAEWGGGGAVAPDRIESTQHYRLPQFCFAVYEQPTVATGSRPV